ncbi:MAG: iron donor protein CyaY [Gallionella sp.]|jgi:CyaY protein|nr:iron donor protein CyaY [Gallionella sp.]
MTEAEFNERADAALARIETTVDRDADGAECNRSGNVLEIEFDNGQKIIVNRHDINREIWVAARAGGFHFAWREEQWKSQRDDSELFSKLTMLFAEQGENLHF